MTTSQGASAQGFSIDQLDASKAGETPLEFEYTLDSGKGTGVFIQVLGAQCATVTETINRLVDQRRKQQLMEESAARAGEVVFTTNADSIDFQRRLAAVRIHGWRGITDVYSPDAALRLCRVNADIMGQVISNSNRADHFLKLSSPA